MGQEDDLPEWARSAPKPKPSESTPRQEPKPAEEFKEATIFESPNRSKNLDPFILDASPSETAQFNDLYPARRGGKYHFTKSEQIFGGADRFQDRDIISNHVVQALERPDLPLINIMLSALRSHGCITDVMERHVSIEACKTGQNVENLGGFDERYNQIFLCSNNIGHKNVHGFLLRQLITMFDACVNKYDFRDARHLACTEIRKHNLGHCMLSQNRSRPGGTWSIKNQHRNCVRDMSIISMHHLKFVPMDIAVKAVDEVFTKCYNDLEPIGRRCWDKESFRLADREKKLMGYK